MGWMEDLDKAVEDAAKWPPFGPYYNFMFSTWLSRVKLEAPKLVAHRTHKARCIHGAPWFADCCIATNPNNDRVSTSGKLYPLLTPEMVAVFDRQIERICAEELAKAQAAYWERYKNGK